MSRYQKYLAGALALAWIIAAIHPPDRTGWLLENILVFIFVPVILVFGKYFRISDFSWTCITLFMMLHIVGSHWTYAQVPIGYTLGHLIGSDRNLFDRIVHFSFGFLFAYPIREVFMRLTGAKGFWSYYFPFDIILSLSAMYEIFEWLTAITVSSADAATFIGSQGDFWDTQKDMATAAVGALIAIAIMLIINRRRNVGFSAEMRESFRIQA